MNLLLMAQSYAYVFNCVISRQQNKVPEAPEVWEPTQSTPDTLKWSIEGTPFSIYQIFFGKVPEKKGYCQT